MGTVDNDDNIVLFGRLAGGSGGMHMAIVPVPHRGQWTAECGITMPASETALAVLHGAGIVDDRTSRACWLPPGVHMEDICYKCMRRAGATHVMGMWRTAPPPVIAQIAPLQVARCSHMPPSTARRPGRHTHGGGR